MTWRPGCAGLHRSVAGWNPGRAAARDLLDLLCSIVADPVRAPCDTSAPTFILARPLFFFRPLPARFGVGEVRVRVLEAGAAGKPLYGLISFTNGDISQPSEQVPET
jgi:hypothetical protein